ncbi:MAG: divergent polysaccharide deacetylase family protein [Spirochaetes bacterium]|nr:divergent polysaccharide deacetylase family protein [Spirochaetota bacterium]
MSKMGKMGKAEKKSTENKTSKADGQPAAERGGGAKSPIRPNNGKNRWLLAAAVAAGLIFFSTCVSAPDAEPAPEQITQVLPPAMPPALPEPPPQDAPLALPPEVPPEIPPEIVGSLVFVIDDAGNSLWELEPFLSFPGMLTFAVLPGLPNSAESARRIRAAGMEVILHQPMEAVGGQWPGPGAIFSDMSAEEVRAVLEQNLAEVGPVVGMNNHMGSRITADEEIMEVVLSFAKENGIYFLDSRTTTATVSASLGRRMGIEVVERDVFIDNDPGREAMLSSITAGISFARIRGHVVMIGHVQSAALAPLLFELYDELVEQGFSFAPASSLFNGGE